MALGKKYREEDLGGHEAPPTSKERLETLNNDLKHLDDVNTYLKTVKIQISIPLNLERIL